ncbi:hypothetical protein [Rhizobium gallicum]|uniref:hypothetical protein n=1 Tax=Rhizobium gallicum TaxID=56730 RepID=UPI001EF93B10|nr:hypothetical protein [Rhizobium gallicum]ULJ74498.1 hypothetical protein L2W42_21890 [Rhizobium gallicum]
MPPTTLFHWSRKSLDIFSHNDPKFEVRTQGHAYALDSVDNKSGATSRFEAKSLIVFTEQAAELFEEHPLLTMMGWKRLFRQYWSKKFLHDLRWNTSDAFRCGEVLVIRKAEFARVTARKRIVDQLARRGIVLVFDLLVLGFVIDVVVSANSDWGVIRWLNPQTTLATLLWIMAGGVLTLLTVMCFMSVRKAKKADGSEWDYRSELECAMQAAENARIQEAKRR